MLPHGFCCGKGPMLSHAGRTRQMTHSRPTNLPLLVKVQCPTLISSDAVWGLETHVSIT